MASASIKRSYDDPEGESQPVQKRTGSEDEETWGRIIQEQTRLDNINKDTTRLIASFLHGDKVKQVSIETPWAYPNQWRHPVQAHPAREHMEKIHKSDAVALSLVNRSMNQKLVDYVGTRWIPGTGRPENQLQTAVQAIRWIRDWVKMTRGRLILGKVERRPNAYRPWSRMSYPEGYLLKQATSHRDGGEKLKLPVQNLTHPITQFKIPGSFPPTYAPYTFQEVLQLAWAQVFPRDAKKVAVFEKELERFTRLGSPVEGRPMTGGTVPSNPYEMMYLWSLQLHSWQQHVPTTISFILSAIHAFGGEEVWAAYVFWNAYQSTQRGDMDEYIWVAQLLDKGDDPMGLVSGEQWRSLSLLTSRLLEPELRSTLSQVIDDAHATLKDSLREPMDSDLENE